MNCLLDLFFSGSAVVLGNNYRSSGGQSHKKADEQIDYHGRRSAYSSQSVAAYCP